MLILSISMFALCACTPSAEAPAAAQGDALVASTSGFSVAQPISAGKLDELRSGDKQFVVYFTGKKISETESELQDKLNDLTQNYADAFLCDYYTIPIDDYPAAKDILGGNLFGLVLFRPDGALVLSGDSLGDVGNSFNRFFEYELVAPNDYGVPMVDYQQVMDKIQSGETFLLYIGRDTCSYCRLFSPNLKQGLIEAGLNTPIFYFYVESYHRAQVLNEPDAQEKWDADTASIGFQGTPALLYFKDGMSTTFDFFNTLFPEDAKTQEEFDESNRLCLEAMKNWIAENNIQ